MTFSLSFRPRTTESNYVKVGKHPTAGNVCDSFVGMINRGATGQDLNLSGFVGKDGCYTDDTVVHEFIHAWGFTHEQNRPDRNSFVTIKSANIKDGKEKNFDIKTDFKTYGVQYNGLSVMHYSGKAFAKNKEKPTIVSKVQPNSYSKL